SSFRGRRLSGVPSSMCCRSASVMPSQAACSRGPLMAKPGTRQLTLILYGPRSRARCRVRLITPAFAATYSGLTLLNQPVLRADPDESFPILPLRCRLRCGVTALQTSMAEVRFTAIVRSQCPRSIFSMSPVPPGGAPPALLTTMSIVPHSDRTRSTSPRTSPSTVRSAGAASPAAPPAGGPSAVVPQRESSMSPTAPRAPSRAMGAAYTAPRPPAAPVTIATRFSSLIRSLSCDAQASTFQRAEREAAHDVLLDDERHRENRQRDDGRGRREPAPVQRVVGDEVEDGDRQRARGVAGDDQREDEVVPRRDDAE